MNIQPVGAGPRLAGVELTTERLVLRPLRGGDEDDVFAYRGRVDVNRFLESEPFTAAEVAGFVAERSAATAIERDGDRVTFAVECGGRVIGDVRLKAGRRVDAQGEIGWVFHPDVAGRGYATEAALALVRLGFEELGFHRIWAQLDPRNVASARLCERLGMRREGLMREESWFKGEWGDLAVYGILAREFTAPG